MRKLFLFSNCILSYPARENQAWDRDGISYLIGLYPTPSLHTDAAIRMLRGETVRFAEDDKLRLADQLDLKAAGGWRYDVFRPIVVGSEDTFVLGSIADAVVSRTSARLPSGEQYPGNPGSVIKPPLFQIFEPPPLEMIRRWWFELDGLLPTDRKVFCCYPADFLADRARNEQSARLAGYVDRLRAVHDEAYRTLRPLGWEIILEDRPGLDSGPRPFWNRYSREYQYRVWARVLRIAEA